MCSRILREVLLDARGISRSLSLLSFAHASVAVDLIDYDVVAIKAGTAGGLLRIVFDRSWLWLFILMLLYICELAAISSFCQTRYPLTEESSFSTLE